MFGYGSDFEQHHGSVNVFRLENKVTKLCHNVYKKKGYHNHHHHDSVCAYDDDDVHAANFD
jgi:hypothetical protein